MSAGWEVGDLALCVKVSGWQRLYGDGTRAPSSPPVKPGGVYTVAKVSEIYSYQALEFSDVEQAYAAHNFRKVTPPAADEFDRETIELMNRVGEPA